MEIGSGIPEDDPPIKQGVQEWPLASWKDFARFIAEHYANSRAHIYRGQVNAKWKIESTLDRLEARYPRERTLPVVSQSTPIAHRHRGTLT